jgi:hypothetical protein
MYFVKSLFEEGGGGDEEFELEFCPVDWAGGSGHFIFLDGSIFREFC